ncbi:MAG: DUF5679 domain-containing protein [Dehalococcoidia bacterium]
MEAYCLKCRTKREMQDAKAVTMKNGKPAMQGKCPVCGTSMYKIGGVTADSAASTNGGSAKSTPAARTEPAAEDGTAAKSGAGAKGKTATKAAGPKSAAKSTSGSKGGASSSRKKS